MNRWALLDMVEVPGGGGQLRLLRRDDEFVIKVGPHELMNSRISGSEVALAELACARIAGRSRPRVLIGGLGMGFTLGAALGALGPGAEVVVAELVPAVVAWNRGPLAAVAGGNLSDPRVDIREIDVARLIRSGRSAYDAILLDVDNGPEGMTRDSNDRLYDLGGLGAAYDALRRGGVLAVWSAGPDKGFAQRLTKSGFDVEEVIVRANGKRGGARHTIWLATRD
jgi:spermidine synthase